MCDERLISCFLTLHNPQKYTFYKSDIYACLCNLIGVETKVAGLKLVHFYELLKQHLIPLVEQDIELMDSVNKELQKEECLQSTLLTAQTALWHYVSKLLNNKQVWLFFPGDDEQTFDDMVDGNYISIYEWGEIGSLDNNELRDQKGIRNALKEKVEDYKTKEPGYSVKMLYDMKHNMNNGDYVICRNKDFNHIVAVGGIIGGYYFNPDHPVNNHCVEVKWHRGEWNITQILKESKDSTSAAPRLQNALRKIGLRKLFHFWEIWMTKK